MPNGLSVLLTHRKVIWLAKTKWTPLRLYLPVCFHLSYLLLPFFVLFFPHLHHIVSFSLSQLIPSTLLSSHHKHTETPAQSTHSDLEGRSAGETSVHAHIDDVLSFTSVVEFTYTESQLQHTHNFNFYVDAIWYFCNKLSYSCLFKMSKKWKMHALNERHTCISVFRTENVNVSSFSVSVVETPILSSRASSSLAPMGPDKTKVSASVCVRACTCVCVCMCVCLQGVSQASLV